MTSFTGAWSSNDRLQATLSLTMVPSTVTASTTSVRIDWVLTGRTRYASYENGTGVTDWSLNNDLAASGSMNGWNVGNMGTWTIASGSKTFATAYGASNFISTTAGFTSGGAYPGTHPSVYGSITIPARPFAGPAGVTSVAATRNSDTQATVTWVNHATTGAPYTSHTLQMGTQTGGVWGPWVTTASPTAGAASFVQTGLSANHKYRFQIRANNTVGSSAYAASPEVYMTPGAPTGASSQLNSNGTSITTSWTNTEYTSTTITHEVQRSVGGGAWANVVTGLSQDTVSWIDSSPGAGGNQYRVGTRTSSGSLLSAYSTGNTVSTIVAPLAPTLLVLSPSPGTQDAARDGVIFNWRHNPGGDGAAQSHFRLRYSTDGGVTWTVLANDVASTASTSSWLGSNFTNGPTYLWQVQTEGIVSAGYGPYSASATFLTSSAPVVTLAAGAPAATTIQLPMVVSWAYAQDQGSPQAGWRAILYNTADFTQVLEDRTGFGTGSTFTWNTPMLDGQTYRVYVAAQSAAGLWSNDATRTTTVSLPPPAPIVVTPVYDECAGTMMLHLESTAPVGTQVTAQFAMVERRTPGGEWVVLANMMPVPNDLLDPLPATVGINEYRITSISTAPSYYVNPVVQGVGTDGKFGSELWIFLTWGAGFANTLRFRGNPKTGSTSGRQRVAQGFLGRPKALLLLGEETSMVVSASGDIRWDEECPVTDLTDCRYDSSGPQWEAASNLAGLVAYRDHRGRRLFGMVSPINVGDDEPGYGSVSFTVTETDFTETYT